MAGIPPKFSVSGARLYIVTPPVTNWLTASGADLGELGSEVSFGVTPDVRLITGMAAGSTPLGAKIEGVAPMLEFIVHSRTLDLWRALTANNPAGNASSFGLGFGPGGRPQHGRYVDYRSALSIVVRSTSSNPVWILPAAVPGPLGPVRMGPDQSYLGATRVVLYGLWAPGFPDGYFEGLSTLAPNYDPTPEE